MTSAPWTHGIITAAHVVAGLSLGTTVPLARSPAHSTPASGDLVDVGPSPIDAAVLKIARRPAGLAALAIRDPATKPIAPGLAMRLLGRHTRVSGTVLRVNQNPGYFGPMLAERVVCDTAGIPGDSGALVADSAKSEGLGIYMGTIPSKTGATRDGVAQGLWQATEWLEADIWT